MLHIGNEMYTETVASVMCDQDIGPGSRNLFLIFARGKIIPCNSVPFLAYGQFSYLEGFF